MRAIAIVLTTVFIAYAMSDAPAAAAQDRAIVTAAGRNAGLTDASSQRRRRPRVLIYRDAEPRGVYPQYFPGRNAIRDCTATYVQEFRPSGTVIVPRTNCFWRQRTRGEAFVAR